MRGSGKISSGLVERIFESEIQRDPVRESSKRSGADLARVSRKRRDGPQVPTRVREVMSG